MDYDEEFASNIARYMSTLYTCWEKQGHLQVCKIIGHLQMETFTAESCSIACRSSELARMWPHSTPSRHNGKPAA